MPETRTALAALADALVGSDRSGALLPLDTVVLATPALAAVTTAAAGVGVTAGAAMGTAIATGATAVKGDEEEPASPPQSSGLSAGLDATSLLSSRRTALSA